MRISIITLNFNGSKETIRLLKSLENQSDKNFDVIVVDNASEEADFEKLKQYYTTNSNPTKGIFKTKENLGFSGGCNIGIRQALQNQALRQGSRQASWVVLLNNDTWVENDFIKCLKAILEARSGIVGIPLNEGEKTAYCGRIEWLKPTLQHVRAVHQAKRSIKLNNYAIGGAMAIHKDVFEKIGLLDEKYFLYFEDADFSIRARKVGFNISIAGDRMIYHTVSATTKKLGSPLLLRYHYRNALYFNLKNGPWYIKLAVWPWSWVIVLKQLIKVTVGKNKEVSKAILAGIFDFYKNKYGKI